MAVLSPTRRSESTRTFCPNTTILWIQPRDGPAEEKSRVGSWPHSKPDRSSKILKSTMPKIHAEKLTSFLQVPDGRLLPAVLYPPSVDPEPMYRRQCPPEPHCTGSEDTQIRCLWSKRCVMETEVHARVQAVKLVKDRGVSSPGPQKSSAFSRRNCVTG